MTNRIEIRVVPGGGILRKLDTRDQGMCLDSRHNKRPRRLVKFLLSGSKPTAAVLAALAPAILLTAQLAVLDP